MTEPSPAQRLLEDELTLHALDPDRAATTADNTFRADIVETPDEIR
ncbi:MAG: hypothetical protein ACTHYR_04310 [Brachybacterium sp.]